MLIFLVRYNIVVMFRIFYIFCLKKSSQPTSRKEHL